MFYSMEHAPFLAGKPHPAVAYGLGWSPQHGDLGDGSGSHAVKVAVGKGLTRSHIFAEIDVLLNCFYINVTYSRSHQ
jgi:hypothetical protein